jgi:hypothetical protein
METVVYQSRFRKGLAVTVGVIGSIAIVWGMVQNASATWRFIAPLLLAMVLAWALWWNPAVVVSPGGVEIRNVLSTAELPWPTIRKVDTKYALTIHPAYGQFAAWAAPAPGRAVAIRTQIGTNRDVRKGRADETKEVGIGDIVSSASGQTAALIRERFDQLREAGLLDNPQLERETPKITKHWPTIAALAALLAAAVVGGLV